MGKLQIGDDLVIDRNQRTIYKNGTELALPERSYRLLLALVENSPEIVSHDKLIEAVWQEQVVSDENLKQRISRLRRSLADTSETATYIVAERGIGYRCIAPVKQLVETEIKPVPTIQQTDKLSAPNKLLSRLTNFKVLMGFGLILLAGFIIIFWHPNATIAPDAKIGDFTARDYNNQAKEYYYRFKPQDNKTAIKLYQKAVATNPNDSLAYSGLANAYAQGYYQFGQNEDWLQQSIHYSRRAIETEPEQPWGYKSLGLGLHLGGQFEQSLAAYNQAIKLAPWWSGPVNNSSLVHLEAGRLVLAYQDAVTAVKMDPTDPIPYLFLGLCYRDLDMSEHALSAIEKSVELKPDYLLAHNYLAEYYLIVGNDKKAEELLSQTLQQAPENQFSFWLNAQLYLRQGNQSKAAQNFARAAELGGRYQLPAKINLAIINRETGQLDQFYQALETKINQGNIWSELVFSQALILTANGDFQSAVAKLQKAIDSGLSHAYRLQNSTLFESIADQSEIKSLILKLDNRKKAFRQKVMQLEKNQKVL
ncbi:winged helix-turn-helix domain-containing protein [Aliikangiella coralliicola]|uniref:OmpR/PhoB-type domain-containing protein n=1 Tax=Aliikangiella coralliicola TaxID=2592383 RepID=A0A545UDV4_9GAMM|nr:winged helix-turn-helix domain-containing protein [Aliikangiella coralliicola]TQV87626.1 hypothetical protein FLL46_12205 [Aliikangiella coralliicola]